MGTTRFSSALLVFNFMAAGLDLYILKIRDWVPWPADQP